MKRLILILILVLFCIGCQRNNFSGWENDGNKISTNLKVEINNSVTINKSLNVVEEINTSEICLNNDCVDTWSDVTGSFSTAGGWANDSEKTFTNLNVLVDGGTFFVNSSSNKVGVGTTTPSSELEVNGAVELNNIYDNDGSNFFDLTGCGTSASLGTIDSTGAVGCSQISITEAQISDLDHYTDADIDGDEAAFNGWDKSFADDWNNDNDSLTLDNDSICRVGDEKTALINKTNANFSTIVVENITSPYENKSYIFFKSDGSIGITLDPIESPPQTPEAQSNTVTRTQSTETTCVNGKCNLVLYSGVRYVYEDKVWKELWEAKSLKGIFNPVYLNNDGIHDFEVVDLNYTHIELKVFVKDSKEINKDIPFKVDDVQKTTTKLTSLDEKATVSFSSDNILGSNYSFGSESTVIILRDNNNTDDTYVYFNSPNSNFDEDASRIYAQHNTGLPQFDREGLIKFNISDVPVNSIINEAVLYLYEFLANDNIADTGLYLISDDTWKEGTVTWNNAPPNATTASSIFTETIGFTAQWYNWSITSDVSTEYNGNKLISYRIIASIDSTKIVRFYDREYTTDTTLRPYLNITYSEFPEPGITTTLNKPDDGSVDEDGSIKFNCSATPTLTNITNISLYHNISGTWDLIETDIINDSIYEGTNTSLFSVTGIANNTHLVWNCLSFNNASNSSFASANYSLTVLFPLPYVKNPEFFIQNMTGGILMKVTWLGNMWLRNTLTVVGDLIVDIDTLFVDSVNDRVGIGTTTPTSELHVIGSANITGNIYLNNKTISGVYCINFSNGDTMCGNSSIDVSINGSKYFSISDNGIRVFDDNGTLLAIFNDEEKNFTARFEGSMMNNDNINDSSRFVERNLNNGSGASSVLTVRNDIPYSASFGLTSSTFSFDKIGANTVGLSSVAPGEMLFMNRYNYPFIWYINKQNDTSIENLSEVMRLDENRLNVSVNATFDYANFKTEVIKYHKNGFVNTPDTNWHNMTFNITVDTESTTGFILSDENDTITSEFDGIVKFSYCLHPKNNGAGGTEMGVLSRLTIDDIEIRCSQSFDTQTRKTGYGSDVRAEGTFNITSGSKIRLQYKVDNADLDFEGNSAFDRPVASTIELEKISDLE